MAKYVDGYVIPVPAGKLAHYRRMATRMSGFFLRYGALEVRECVAEDLAPPYGTPFPAVLKTTSEETVVFSWVVFKSRKDRDRINAAVMKDPAVLKLCDPSDPVFNPKRMVCGGFKTIVDVVA